MKHFLQEINREVAKRTQKKDLSVKVLPPFIAYNSSTNEVSVIPADENDEVYTIINNVESNYTGKVILPTNNTAAGYIKAYSRRNGIPSETVTSKAFNKKAVEITTVNFDYKIYINGTLPDSISDFKTILENYYNQPFAELTGSGVQGIHIYNAKEVSGYSQILGDDYHQDFYIQSTGDKIILAHDGTPQSLNNGLYYILSQLGFVFAHMNPEWVVEPKSIIGFVETGVKRPAIRNRQKFGTGAFGSPIPNVELGSNNQIHAVALQDRRNFWNSDFYDTGHALTFLYQEGQTVEELAELAIQPICDIITNNPNAEGEDFPYNIGAGAPDGFGFTEDGANYFYQVANRMAEKLSEIQSSERIRRGDPNFKIRTFVDKDAYGDGIYAPAPPNFPLHSNIYMRLIPYAFQKKYATALEMFNDWNARKQVDGFKGFGIYDYWAISQWAIGRPHLELWRLDHVKDWLSWGGINSVNIESTHGINVSVHHWVASRLMTYWSDAEILELYDEYFEKVFGDITEETPGNAGGAGFYIKKLFLGWAGAYDKEVSLSQALWDCWMAYNTAETNEIKVRVLDVAAYIHWLLLYNKGNDSTGSYAEFVNYTYRIYNRQLVHTYPILYNYYVSPHAKPGTGGFTHFSTSQLMNLFLTNLKNDLHQHRLSDGIETFSFDIKKAKPHPSYPQITAGIWGNFWQMTPPESGEYPIDIACTSLEGIFRITDNEFMNAQKSVSVPIPSMSNIDHWEVFNPTNPAFYKDKTYYISFGTYYNADYSYQYSWVRFNRRAVYFKNMGGESFPNAWFTDWYFYVPKACKQLVFEDFYLGANGLGFIGYRREQDLVGYIFVEGKCRITRLEKDQVEWNAIKVNSQGSFSGGFKVPVDGSYTLSFWIYKTFDPDFNHEYSVLIDNDVVYTNTYPYNEMGWELVTIPVTLTTHNRSITFQNPIGVNRGRHSFTQIKITDNTGINYVTNGDMSEIEKPIALNEERMAGEYVYSSGNKIVNIAPQRYKIYVPPAGRGKIWKARMGTPFWRLINLENLATSVPFLYEE